MSLHLRRAFTLLELLAVVAIIALLVSILVPSLRSARKLAQDIKCRTNERGPIYTGLVMYSEDWSGWIPPTGGLANVSWATLQMYLQGNVRTYLGWNSGNPKYGSYLDRKSYASTEKGFICPSAVPVGWQSVADRSYGLNAGMTSEITVPCEFVAVYTGIHPNTGALETGYQYNLQRTRSPSNMYLLGDTPLDSGWFNAWSSDGLYPSFRHSDRCNVLYHDGHVVATRWQDMPTRGYESPRTFPWYNGTSYTTAPKLVIVPGWRYP